MQYTFHVSRVVFGFAESSQKGAFGLLYTFLCEKVIGKVESYMVRKLSYIILVYTKV